MRSLAVIAALFLAALLGGCGLLPEVKDETVGWSANKLYAEAKEAMNEGSYEKAVQYFEKLESRYPYGRFAQQAQIDMAYAYWKDNEAASAIAACDRFIKLHPSHPAVDYVYYLKGLINFNEDIGLMGHISLQDMTEFELPQKKLQRVQPENAKDGYLYFQLDTGDASANAPVLVIGLEKSRFFADAIPVHILLTIPEHGVSIQLTGTVSAQTVVLTAPTSRMKDEDIQTLVQIRDTIQSVLQFVQTAANSVQNAG